MASRIVVRDVDAGYGAVRVLHGVSIEVRDGETVALLGTNGNGKSTLIKCIMGMVTPEAGEIFLETRRRAHRPHPEVHRGDRGPGHRAGARGAPALPEADRRGEPPARRLPARPPARDIARNLDFCFEAFPVLRQRRRQLAGSMSGGEQQMLAVARALMSSPRILLVDEPSVGLAPILVSRVIAKIKELKERRQLTVLMAEQNFNQATKIADRGYIIVHGKIEFEGRSTRELRENELVKKYYLGV